MLSNTKKLADYVSMQVTTKDNSVYSYVPIFAIIGVGNYKLSVNYYQAMASSVDAIRLVAIK